MKKKFFLAKNELKNIQNVSESLASNPVLQSSMLLESDQVGGVGYVQSYTQSYNQSYTESYTRRIQIL